MNHSEEVSDIELTEFKHKLANSIDPLLPRSITTSRDKWMEFYWIYDEVLVPIFREIIRREREVRDKILSDMQKDSVAYEEGYAEGAEAMRKEALRILFECDRVDPVYERIKAATVDPPSRR